MNGKTYKLFVVMMALVLAVSMAGIGVMQDSDSASAATTLKWTEIPIPDQDDFQLAPCTDLGPIAVTPDGGTLFAAVYSDPGSAASCCTGDGKWRVYKSTDGGYTWKETGFVDDGSQVMDLHVSPRYGDDDRLFVATVDHVWRSGDGGDSFQELGNANPAPAGHGGDINCMHVGVDADNIWTLVIGTDDDVYVWVDGFWVGQTVDFGLDNLVAPGVLDVAFVPTYGEEAMTGFGWVVALVRANRTPSGVQVEETLLRCETQVTDDPLDPGNWGAPVQDCAFHHNAVLEGVANDKGILATHGVITFADDFADQQSVFVGLQAFDPDLGPPGYAVPLPPATVVPRGDVFRVDLGWGIIYPSTYEDLNVRGDTPAPTECNIWSLAVSGNANSAYILAGLVETSLLGDPSVWQSSVHYSDSGGNFWLPSYDPPGGIEMLTQFGQPRLVLAPDFATSGIAYVATAGSSATSFAAMPNDLPGQFSGFWASTTDGTTWNGRGLLDFTIEAITDIAVSPDYSTDENMFMVTQSQLSDFCVPGVPAPPFTPGVNPGLLWETTDAGTHWEVILAMNALFPLPGIIIEYVQLADNYPSDPTIFVTGLLNADMNGAMFGGRLIRQDGILSSTDGGNTFVRFVNGPPGLHPVASRYAWDVVDSDTIFLGDPNGSVWWTDNAGFHWDEADITDDGIASVVVENDAVLVGTGPPWPAMPITSNPYWALFYGPAPYLGSGHHLPTRGSADLAGGGDVYVCYDYDDDFTFDRVGTSPGEDGDAVLVDFDADYDVNDIVYGGVINMSYWINNYFNNWLLIPPFTGYPALWPSDGEVWRFDLGSSVWEQISSAIDAPAPPDWVSACLPNGKFTDCPGASPMYVSSLKCGADGTLYSLDVHNRLGWRSVDPREDPIDLGEEPLWEPIGEGLGWPSAVGLAGVLESLEVVPGSNILIAIGTDDTGAPSLWYYIDTLTRELGPVDLAEPDNGETGVGQLDTDGIQVCLILVWEEASGADRYEWEVALDPQFTQKVAHHAFLGEIVGDPDTQRYTNGEVIDGCLQPGRTYYWHVRVDEPYQSPWSDTWSFTTMYTSKEEAPVLISPTGGEEDVSTRPALQWTSAIEADSYELILGKCSDWLTNPVVEKSGDNSLSGAATAYQVTQTLAEGTNYCWKVTAVKDTTTKVDSDTGTFTTKVTLPVEEEEGTPVWVWVVIAVSALMLVAVIVLIVLTKKT